MAFPPEVVEPELELEQEQEQEPEELVPEEVAIALRDIYLKCEREDLEIRIKYMSQWRQLQLYAKGVFDLFWDESAKDWRSFSDEVEEEDNSEYNRNINIFRGHMESVVAALSIKLPSTEFIPDDADNPLDLETAKGFSDVSDLIQRHNKSKLLLIKALYIFWTQGTVAAYNYYRTDPKFGTVQVPRKEAHKIMSYDVYCQECGNLIGSVKETPPVSPLRCENCGLTAIPETVEYPETIERIVGYQEESKGREVFDFYGPINVKIPFYAKKQENIGYLIFKDDVHHCMVKSEFKEYEDELSDGSPSMDAYERYMRLVPEYGGNIPNCLNTVSCIWLRPWMYYCVNKDAVTINGIKVRDYLFQMFPKGAYYIYVDEKLVAIDDKCLDDNWTISVDPLSDFIHGEPLGKPLVPVVEMRNDLVSLAFQSIEYSIPENFADPKVLDFKKYKNQQALPGMFTPATPRSGLNLADSFFQTTPSHLSEEVQVFGEKLDQDGQFVSHDFPSVFGGPSEGSKTAFEYQKSNVAALQALGLSWTRVLDMWGGLMSKSCVEFIEHMKEDEKNVKKESGKWINVWIRKQNLTGKIGGIEPNTSETLPQSWEQKWQIILNLLQMQDPVINQALLSPENAGLLKQASNLTEFFIPGDHDRTKQLGEIYDIINGDPSVGVDFDVDEHFVHKRIIKNYLVSPVGVYLYKTNPQAYAMIIMHYKQHDQAEMMQAQKEAMMQPPEVKSNESNA